MGGFTAIYLRDTSEENVNIQNEKLREYKVPKRYRFYGEGDIKAEFKAFKNGEGVFPEYLFPKTIILYSEFKKYWNPKAIGEAFCPRNGSITFDCYFGRMSDNAMKNLARYISDNHEDILGASGSFSTFVERGATKKGVKVIENSLIQDPLYFL